MATIAAGLGCLFSNAQPQAWQRPDSIEFGRELPRSFVLPFDSRESALMLNGESKYIQPLNGKWDVTENTDRVVYKTTYKRPFSWIDRLLFVYVEGVSAPYEVVVNGKQIGYNQSSRTPAEFDISAQSEEGNNTLEIVIFRNSVSEKLSVNAGQPRILGDVYVMSPPKVRIRDWDIRSTTDGKSARMEMGVALKSHLLNVRGVRLYYELLSPDGKLITEGYRDAKLDMKREDIIRFYVEIPEVKLWSHETPNLYTMLFRTQHEGRFTEYVRVKSGIRDFKVKDDGEVSLNGYPLRLAVKDVDVVPSDQVAARDMLLQLKAQGYNAVRVVNAPQRRWFYNLCDGMGVYVCDQTDINSSASGGSMQVGGNPTNDPVWERSYVDRAMNMYYTSQSHPSVIMFSLGENSANGYNLYESYLALKGIENVRPIIYIGAKGEWNSDAVSQTNVGADRHSRVVLVGDPTVKVVENPVTLSEVKGGVAGTFVVTNHYAVTPLSMQVRYEVKRGRKPMSEGVIDLFVAAGSSREFVVPFGEAAKGVAVTVELTAQQPEQKSTDYYYVPQPEEKKSGLKSKIKEVVGSGKSEERPMSVLANQTFTVTVR